MNSIELERLTKSFPRTGKAVDDISLAIAPGEFVTLLGPSGCGKTTTLRLIAGFEYPDLGAVRLSGRDITDDPPYRRPVNTVFQDYALFPHMTVAGNVGYGMRVAGKGKPEIARRVADALQMVGLSDKAAARPSELSGGQRQRVALARALVREPKVLLLDEPLSALDAKLREAMQVELRHLHRRIGITFVLVTHDQTEAMVMSDRVIVMDRGRVVQDGAPVDLYNRPVNAYVATFLGTSNLLPAEALARSGDRLAVKVAGAVLNVPVAARDVAPGSAVTLAIRPEKALLRRAAPDAAAPAASLRGRILEHQFHGGTVRSAVDIGLAAPFLVDTQLSPNAEFASLPAPGEACIVEVGEKTAIVFPGSAAP